MINRKSTFVIGIFIFLVPFMGLPTFWKTLFVAISGIILVFLSIGFPVSVKKVPKKIKKEKVENMLVENTPVYPKDNIIVVEEVKKRTRTRVKQSE